MNEQGEERWLDVDGFRVHAVEWGNGDARVLLVHGLGGNTISWEPVASDARRAPARDRHRRRSSGVRPHPGSRRAARRRWAPTAACFESCSSGRAPPRSSGNSMGGALGVGLAARHPDLVRALVLVDPAQPLGPRRTPRTSEAHGRAWRRRWSRRSAAACWRHRARLLGARAARRRDAGHVRCCRPERLDPALRRRLVDLADDARSPSPRPRARSSTRPAACSGTSRAACRRDLAQVTAPTLLVHGDERPARGRGGVRARSRRAGPTVHARGDRRLRAHAPARVPEHFVDLRRCRGSPRRSPARLMAGGPPTSSPSRSGSSSTSSPTCSSICGGASTGAPAGDRAWSATPRSRRRRSPQR